ncbi:NUMOD4 domain-containing protein [Pseudomonas sp. ChxA]|uniref:NUMOD4 domain-containing protein n=1 Tax=Pseudomonas sp. ChxA TaxID=3035473 RepID=UPI00255221F4|nr:NUMOD4 domain-containing protein [Pseudomonas sp. ChxA]MDL2185607.1 NUMOD4 domain-containing protein [Pseudomonas sp. ChxA]
MTFVLTQTKAHAKHLLSRFDEVFTLIEGFSDYYVSNKGNVFSVKRRTILMPAKSANGRMKVILRSDESGVKQLWVHRLVAKAFLANPNDFPNVGHANSNPADNNMTNLVWGVRPSPRKLQG